MCTFMCGGSLLYEVRKKAKQLDIGQDIIKVITMCVRKALEYLVALVAIRRMFADCDEARPFYLGYNCQS